MKYKITILLFLFAISLKAQNYDYSYKFRVYLKDKGETNFTLDNPREYLSQRSLDRREKQKIAIDSKDLPISQYYISQLEDLGCIIVAKSKWLETISVHCEDSALVKDIKKLDFVKDAVLVWKGIIYESINLPQKTQQSSNYDPEKYGQAYEQIKIHKGDSLHNAGYSGEGMQIAVLDAGYYNFHANSMFDNLTIEGTRDFVYKGVNMFYSSEHGINALSCMATNKPNQYIGSAPEASYWLLRTEDTSSEYPIEEDYWVTAAEYADSIGVDLINSSLGYTTFNKPTVSYTYEQMDGHTAYITRGAETAVEKGIFVVVSAGNEGNKSWRKIVAPADGKNVFTIGAINKNGNLAAFSSRGPTADNRTKPDVVAVGEGTLAVDGSGFIIPVNGTSFSGPVMCGLIACLWEAFSELTNKEIADVVRKSSDRYNSPDNDYGHGIPDMVKAMEIARTYHDDNSIASSSFIEDYTFITDSTGFRIIKHTDDGNECNVDIFNIEGKPFLSEKFSSQEKYFIISPQRTKSIYIVTVTYQNKTNSYKLFF